MMKKSFVSPFGVSVRNGAAQRFPFLGCRTPFLYIRSASNLCEECITDTHRLRLSVIDGKAFQRPAWMHLPRDRHDTTRHEFAVTPALWIPWFYFRPLDGSSFVYHRAMDMFITAPILTTNFSLDSSSFFLWMPRLNLVAISLALSRTDSRVLDSSEPHRSIASHSRKHNDIVLFPILPDKSHVYNMITSAVHMIQVINQPYTGMGIAHKTFSRI